MDIDDCAWTKGETDVTSPRELGETESMVVLGFKLGSTKAAVIPKKLSSKQGLSTAAEEGEPKTNIMTPAMKVAPFRSMLFYQSPRYVRT